MIVEVQNARLYHYLIVENKNVELLVLVKHTKTFFFRCKNEAQSETGQFLSTTMDSLLTMHVSATYNPK